MKINKKNIRDYRNHGDKLLDVFAIKYKGVITIEASIIIPMFIYCLIAIFIMGMYLHDMVVTKSIVGSSAYDSYMVTSKDYNMDLNKIDYQRKCNAHKLKDLIKEIYTGDDNLSAVRLSMLKNLQDNLLICDVTNVEIKKQLGKVTAKANIRPRIKSVLFYTIFDKDLWISEEHSTVDVCEVLRFTQAVDS